MPLLLDLLHALMALGAVVLPLLLVWVAWAHWPERRTIRPREPDPRQRPED